MSTNDLPKAYELGQNPIDLSGYKTAYGAARKLYETLQAIAEDIGQNPDEVSFYDPAESRRVRDMHPDGADVYTVSWEAGPWEWALALSGGDSIYANEFGSYGLSPEVVGFYESDGWSAEPYYSFDLQFFNE